MNRCSAFTQIPQLTTLGPMGILLSLSVIFAEVFVSCRHLDPSP